MIGSFGELGLPASLLDELTRLGYEEPTPIQTAAIPPLLAGSDLLGQAATGTGKTAAFALPMLVGLGERSTRARPAALILVPTRELAMQVSEAVHRYGRGLGVRVVPIYGGQHIGRQLDTLRRGVDVVVATPGRALDHIARGTLKLDDITTVVLDEADEMLDMGFAEDIEAILAQTPPQRQTVLFSATMPARINQIARRHLTDPVRIELGRTPSESAENLLVRQVAYVVRRAHKPAALGRILDVEAPEAAIVFCRTRNEVDELSDQLNGRGYRAEALHGGMDQSQRDKAMGRLKSGTADLLVATDVAARGLDIDQLSHVINYDVPSAPEAYIHRIGRVGRAGREGVAITLAEPREHRLMKNIERVTKQRFEIEKVPTIADMRAKRMELLRGSIRELLIEDESEIAESYRVVVESLSDEFDPMEIAMAAVRLAHINDVDDVDPVEIPDAELRPAGGGAKAKGQKKFERGPKGKRGRGAGMVRLWMSMGRNQGLRPKDVVGAIAGESGIAGRAIGSIEISGTFSLVEIPEDSVEQVIRSMKGAKIRGKSVTVRRDRS